MFVDAADRLLLVDRDRHRIVRLDASGNVSLTIEPWPGNLVGEPFLHPADVAVSEAGDIYVAGGYGNARIHRFTDNGEYVISWGAYGTRAGEFRVPHGIGVRRGIVYVADRENGRVQLFTAEGQFLESWDYLYRPTDIFMADDVLFVTDMLPSVTVLSREGEVIARCRLPMLAAHSVWGGPEGSLYVVDGASEMLCKLVREAPSTDTALRC